MMYNEESVLSVLMYLFKYHMHDNCDLGTVENELMPKLQEAGFHKLTIVQAFVWLENLAELNSVFIDQETGSALRVFSEFECSLISSECRGLLLGLEQKGILNFVTRELVINQVLALAKEEIDLSLIKWVTLMVLFNQPNEEKALACMEYLVLDEEFIGEKH